MGESSLKFVKLLKKSLYFIVFSSIFLLQNFGGINELRVNNSFITSNSEESIFDNSNLDNFDSSSIVDDFGTSRSNFSRLLPVSYFYTLNIYFKETENLAIPFFERAESVLHNFLFRLTPF